MAKILNSRTFNRQETTTPVTVGGKTETVITELAIETAEPIVLTQDAKLLDKPGHQYVPPTAHLKVYGDTVTIEGPLKLEGKDLLIFARKFSAVVREDAADSPEIVVNGPALPDEIGHPKALPQGANPPNNPLKGKKIKGVKGADAENTTILPFPSDDARKTSGGAGWSGPDHPDEMDGEDGEQGHKGNKAGDVSILCGSLIIPPEVLTLHGELNMLPISAVGGKGGDGQPGQQGADGGDGGDGFDAKAHAGFMGAGRMESCPGGPGGKGGWGGDGGPPGQGGDGGKVQVHVISAYPNTVWTTLVSGGDPGEPGNPGDGGKFGSGGRAGKKAEIVHYGVPPAVETIPGSPAGKDGRDGDSGGEKITVLKSNDGSVTPSQGDLLPSVLMSNARVSQLVMMFEKVRAEYLVSDPAGDKEVFADIKERLRWVTTLLREVPTTHADYGLAAAVLPAALVALSLADHGLDYFGNGAYEVPSVSVGVYRESLKRNLEVLKEVEKVADTYFAALHDEHDATASLQLALDRANLQEASLQGEATNLMLKIRAEAATIDSLEMKRKAERPALKSQLDQLKTAVENSFGLSPETLFNCLAQLSFTSIENPPGAIAMIGSQVGAIVTEGLKNVRDDHGELVNKNYVLGSINRFDSPDLKDDFKRNANGFLSDTASYRTIVEYEKMKRLIDDFRKKPAAADASIGISKLIELLKTRNRHIDYYNELLRALMNVTAETQRLGLEKRKVQDGLALKTPGLTPMANFVSGLYERTKADCIEALYMLSRAQSFWALNPLTAFYEQLGRTPQGIKHAQLAAAEARIDRELTSLLEQVRRTPNRFPASEDGDSAQGVLVVLTRENHPDFFEDLEVWQDARFELAVATHDSPAPNNVLAPTMAAYSPGTKPPDPGVANPFNGKADVRLTKVRAWLIGMKTTNNNMHNINITIEHSGREMFRRPDDTSYPEPRQPNDAAAGADDPRLVHTPLRVPFIYKADGMMFDPGKGFVPGKIKNIPGAEDGDLGYSLKAQLGLPGSSGYAAIGPFAVWRLIVRKLDNPDLVFKDLHTVVIDFHGFHQVFKS